MRKIKSADHLAQELRDCDLTALFKIKIPEVAIHQRDHDRSTEKADGGTDVIAPAKIHSVDPGGGIGREGQGKELEKNSERNAGAPLEQSSDRKRQQKDEDENRECFNASLGVDQTKHIREDSLTTGTPGDKRRVNAAARRPDMPSPPESRVHPAA